MIHFDWKGKIGYGDIISPICYAHALAQRNCEDVHFTMHWMHKRGERFKPDDAETLDARMKVLFRNVQPIDYHRVTYTQHFATNMDYNHSNYDDFEDMHNLWWSKVKNVDNGRKSIVLNTTATHREQFEDYAPEKNWKDPVGVEGWRTVESIIKDEWGFGVEFVDYTTPIDDAIDIYKKAFLAVGYHGSAMWIARYLGCPMLIYSTKSITKRAFPWAQVRNKFDREQFISTDPYKIRRQSKDRLTEVKKQYELFLNTPNLHRLRGKRT